MLHWRTVARLLVSTAGLLMVSKAAIGLPAAINLLSLNLVMLQRQGGNPGTDALLLLGAARIGPSLILAAIGVALVWWGSRVVVVSEPASEQDVPIGAPDLRSLEAILVAVLGTYFLADGLIDFVRALASETTNVIVNGAPWSALLWPQHFAFYGAGAVKVVLGVWLILRKQGAVAVYYRLRQWIEDWRRFPYVDGRV